MKIKKGEYKVVVDSAQGGDSATSSEIEAPTNWGNTLKRSSKDVDIKVKTQQKIKDILRRAVNTTNPGDLPKKFKRELTKDENPQITWKKILERYIAEAEDDPTVYKIPNRRYITRGLYLPGLKGKEEGHGAIVIVIDTSCLICQDPNCRHGMSGQIFRPFLKELRDVLKKFKGKDYYIVYSSDGVDGVDRLKTPAQALDRTQMRSTGGNTNSFNPAIEWTEKNIIKKDIPLDCLIYFTDGYAPPPKKPWWYKKIIWAMISDKSMPFGRKVYIPIKDGDTWRGFSDDFRD